MTEIQNIILAIIILAVGAFIGWMVTAIIKTRSNERHWNVHSKDYDEYVITQKDIELIVKKQCMNLLGILQLTWQASGNIMDRLLLIKALIESDHFVSPEDSKLLTTRICCIIDDIEKTKNSIGTRLLKMNPDNPDANGETYKQWDDQVRGLEAEVSRLKRKYADKYHEEYK